jgi:hypothetical protein
MSILLDSDTDVAAHVLFDENGKPRREEGRGARPGDWTDCKYD